MNAVILLSSLCILIASDTMPDESTAHIDCNGVVAERSFGNTTACCDTVAYDRDEQTCCFDQLMPNPVSKRPYGCCPNLKSDGTPELYDIRRLGCCESVGGHVDGQGVYHRYTGCCEGRDLDDSEAEICCDYTIYKFSPTLYCCNNEQVYNPEEQLCAIYHNPEEKIFLWEVMDKNNSYTYACKMELYDRRTHICCDDTVVKKSEALVNARKVGCCKTTPYNPYEHLCCISGKLIDRPIQQGMDRKEVVANYPQCCGDELFTNHTWQMCCGDAVVDRPAPGQGSCE